MPEPREFTVQIQHKGRLYRAPFRCFCCGTEISASQFSYSTLCPTCDTGSCGNELGLGKPHHPPFDPSTIPSEWVGPIESELKDTDTIRILMRRIGYTS